MAWQSGSATAGGGGSGTGDAAGVQAYTLQGVMRFLQTEWHRHERDRNAWEIERAEMKSRIGRLEGESKTSKRLHDSLGKHVKILESALKREREKVKSLTKGEKVDLGKDAKELAREELKSIGKESLLKRVGQLDPELDPDDDLQQGIRQETERDKSKTYLGKCSSEVTYHVMPTTHIPPDLSDPPLTNHVFQNQQPSQQALQEAYVQQQQQQQQQQHQQQQQQQQQQKQQHRNNMSMVRENSVQNHQAMPPMYNENVGLSRSNTQINHGALPMRDSIERKNQDQNPTPLTAIDSRRALFEAGPLPEEQVESVTHSYDSYGKQLPSRDEVDIGRTIEDAKVDNSESWDFDDPNVPTEAQPDSLSTHRPDTDAFPNADLRSSKSPPRGPGSHRRKSSGARRRSDGNTDARELTGSMKSEAPTFKVRFALRGHLDVVRSVMFTGGGSPSEPEICTAGDDGSIKRWTIPASYGTFGSHSAGSGNDLDITSYFTHRGHSGAVTSLAACPASQNFSNGGRTIGDGWIFSGGQDASVRVWERGRVDPKATLEGHKDAVWALCVLPGTTGSLLGDRCNQHGGPDQILLAAGGADGTILLWAVSAPPQLNSPHAGSNRGARGSRRANSVSAGSNFPSSPQPSTATSTPFHYSLVHQIVRADRPAPTCISPLSPAGDNFVVSYADASILVFDTRTGEEVVGMASLETYDGTPSTGVNAVVASTVGFDGTLGFDPARGLSEDEAMVHGATGSRGGVEGVIISGYEDRYIRFFDANSGQCTYTMLAHPSAISSLSLSPDGRELVSAGHDASLRFWSLERRSCTQEITSHRIMRGEGVCSVVWSQDGRWVVSAGGDGVVKVFAR